MSIDIARAAKAAVTGIAAAAFLFVQQAAADDFGATRIAVKNCTNARVLVCAYNKTDATLALPYDANTIPPNRTDRLSCRTSGECKVFTVVDYGDLKKLFPSGWNTAAIAVNGGSAPGNAGAGIALQVADTTTATGVVLVGAAGGAAVSPGATIAILKTIQGTTAGKKCADAMSHYKKAIAAIAVPDVKALAQDALNQQVKGNWPTYMDYSFVLRGGVSMLITGNRC